MRIAFASIMSGAPWSASEALWSETARLSLLRGHQVLISVYDWRSLPPQLLDLQARGAILHLRSRTRILRRSTALTHVLGTYRPLEAFSADIICVNQGGTYDIGRSGNAAGLRRVLSHSGTPFVLLCHCEQPQPPKRHLQRARQLFQSAAIVGVVAQKLQMVAERHLRVSLPHARVFHNPVNLGTIRQLPWPSDNACLRFAFVARLDPVKNLESLLEALAHEHWRTRSWTLSIFGQGAHRTRYEQLAAALNLSDRVTFRGHVADIESIWRQHHALILPSHFEGVPLAMIEALLCGRPVIATNVGGIGEWIDDGTNGFLIPAPTPAAVDATLERVWGCHSTLQSMGISAHQRTVAKRDDQPAATLLSWLEEASDKKSGLR